MESCFLQIPQRRKLDGLNALGQHLFRTASELGIARRIGDRLNCVRDYQNRNRGSRVVLNYATLARRPGHQKREIDGAFGKGGFEMKYGGLDLRQARCGVEKRQHFIARRWSGQL